MSPNSWGGSAVDLATSDVEPAPHPSVRTARLKLPMLPLALSAGAVLLSFVTAMALAPSPTFLNQGIAFFGWGALLALLSAKAASVAVPRGMAALAAALLALIVAAAVSTAWRTLPSALGVSAVATLCAALFAATAAASLLAPQRPAHFRLLVWVLLAAGALSVVFAQIQYFAPQWTESLGIAPPSGPRVAANLRQPNHLGTLLLWCIVCVTWCWPRGAERQPWAWLVLAGFVFCIVQTGSRTAALGVLVLAGWGVLDRRLPRAARLALIASPVLYLLCWFALDAWAGATGAAFAGEGRFAPRENFSSNRLAIWSNTWELIKANPWFGVGWGNFNFAWTLTPFPDRPPEFFDHTHNLFLQLAVELGLPLAAAVSGLLCFAFWRAFRASQAATGEDSRTLRAAFMIVLLAGLHSQFEYPLWYAYFLLPTASAFGLCLGGTDGDEQPPARSDGAASRWRTTLITASLAVSLGGALSVLDYLRVSVIFAPGDATSPLGERIAAGTHSVLFAHHAHYAAATLAPHPSQVMPSFDVASHYLLDTRLMIAWAKAHAELGDLDRARHIAERLREFGHADAQAFFAPCAQMYGAMEEMPFQCAAPARALSYRDFL